MPPPAQTGSAVVGVFVGGDRIDETQVGPLQGATFGFYTSRPTAYDPTTGFATATPAYTCASQGDGWCSVRIPIGATGVASGTRLWVAATGGPAGWYDNPEFQTAPLTGAALRLTTQHVFQTPALQSNGRYLSGTSGFMGDPGTTTTDTAFNNANGGTGGSGTTSNNFQRRTASGGFWPLSAGNPALPDRCGLKVALVVDLSSSVVGHVTALKSAMDEFVDAMRGSPSQLALVTFGTGSPANGFPNTNTGLMPAATTADSNRIKSIYAGWGDPPTNFTNWDAGLDRVASMNDSDDPNEHFDATIVLTDGNPTVYGEIPGYSTSSPTIPTGSGFTRFRELESSIASANRVKDQGSRVIAVGVGDGLDAGAARNLRSISGPARYAPGGDIASADYLQEPSYADAGDALRDLVISRCAPSISVIKQIVPFGGDVPDAYTPGVGWQFTAGTATPGAAVTPPATRTTDTYTGGTNFDVTVPADGTAGTFGIDETPQPNYSLAPVNSTGDALDPAGQNAFCVDKTHDDRPVPVTDTGPNGFSVDLVSDSAISCIVYNQAPDYTEASVLIHKRWRVTTSAGTTTYDHGQQPDGLEAFLRLGGPAPAGPSEQPWGAERHGYVGRDTVTPPGTPGEDVNVAEDVNVIPPGCTLTSATMSGTGIDGERDLGTSSPSTTVDDIQQGRNEWLITNTVTCHSHLTLLKEVHNGPASPADWTLHALGGEGPLAGPSGTTGVSGEVTPEATYQLAEERGEDPELLNYVQPDERSRPLLHPDSTGSADCIQTDGGEVQPGDPQGVEGAVSVPLGQTYTCTFTNITAPLRVIKHVDGGDADPSDFTFHLTAVPPHPVGLPGRSFHGAAAPGYETIVRPGQTYRLTEAEGPDGYQLTSLHCGAITPRSAGHDLTIPAGSNGVCTATNSYSRWTVEKHSDPPPGDVAAGSVITYTLVARHLEGNPTHDVIVTDDLSGVLAHADFVHGSIDASAGSAHLDGDHVVWTIPLLDGTQRVTFQVRVHGDAGGSTLVNRLGEHTTYTPDPDDPTQPDPSQPPGIRDDAVDCSRVPGEPDPCDETVHHVEAEQQPAGYLPGTGGPALGWLLGGSLLAAAGTTLVAYGRRRRP